MRLYLVSTEKISELVFWLCIAVAIYFRIVHLGYIPGINGDEAYIGTKVVMFLQGNDISLWTGERRLPPDPISFILSMAVHSIMDISFVALRLPSVISSVLTIIISFVLFRRLWGYKTSLLITAFIAVLPVHIAYARFFWEPSQTPLLAVLCIYFSFQHRISGIVICAIYALLIHPTNIYLLPVMAAAYSVDLRNRIRLYLTNHSKPALITKAGISLLVLVLIAVMCFGIVHYMPNDHPLKIALVRVLPLFYQQVENSDRILSFGQHYAEFMSGLATYSYIVGFLPSWYRWASILFFSMFWIPVLISVYHSRNQDLMMLAIGCLLSLLVFYLTVGSVALSPGIERYSLWMTVPHCLLLAHAYQHLKTQVSPRIFAVMPLLVVMTLLATFHHSYLQGINNRNSLSEKSFMSGYPEPKEQAFGYITETRNPHKTVQIITEDWSTYWVFKYQSLNVGDIKVGVMANADGSAFKPDFRYPSDVHLQEAHPDKVQRFYVGYQSGRLQNTLSIDPSFTVRSFSGFADTPVLVVFNERVPPPG